ncbi:MAG: PhoX family phosphatase [Proteobacteria bacterium]|nr:PhoX family phosphatase [Pseudomonadota bacterium]
MKARFGQVNGAAAFGDMACARMTRRGFLGGSLALGASAALWRTPAGAATLGFNFDPIGHGVDGHHHVAPGHNARVLMRWGDGVTATAPPFDPERQSAAAQAAQFGYNSDFIGYLPLPRGSGNSRHGLLCVNHEYCIEELMFPELGPYDENFSQATPELANIEMAAIGGAVLEVTRGPDGLWKIVPASRFARRITAGATVMRLSGPAAGHARLKTTADPSGARVIGTVANCSGGMTPWGTWLTAEENFLYCFGSGISDDPEAEIDPALADHPESRNYRRLGLPGRGYAWSRFEARWNIDQEPNEANRFGWIVEIDPLDPHSIPVKRTALGRFSHEGAAPIVNGDGRVVVYSADDYYFEYFYRFVSERAFDPARGVANGDLLDHGILSVARIDADGGVAWLPLVFGQGPLVPENDFYSQADIAIETRRAADLLGATPLDRPEGVAIDPRAAPDGGKLYLSLTKNERRGADRLDAVHSRSANLWGQIIELTAPGGDHAAERFTWDILVACGDPAAQETAARWHGDIAPGGWFSCPDNLTLDSAGRLWVATDQGGGWAVLSGSADGLWALHTQHPRRGLGAMFFRAPVGAEVAGPCFTPDGESLFLSVQHPAKDGAKNYAGFERESRFADAATHWPDFDPAMPPRPSVLAITRQGGGRIG